MLRYEEHEEFRLTEGMQKIWVVACADLHKKGLRAPQGFSFAFGRNGQNFMWTTNEFNAHLFYKRYNWATPEVEAHFRRREEQEEALYQLSFATDSTADFRRPADMQYRPHQKAGIEYCLRSRNTLIADEQRLGKTAIAIGVINNAPSRKVLILCPKTAKLGWLRELNMWLVEPRRIQVIDARSEIDESADIYIINYDILHMKPQLQRITFDLVIPDECHMVARADARRTKFFLALKARKKIGLSGTPLLNNPKDLLTIAKWLDPFWEPFRVVRQRFVADSGITLTLEEAQRALRSSVMCRRLQAQVFENEPPEINIVPIAAPETIRPVIEQELTRLEDYGKVRRVLGLAKVPYALHHLHVYMTEGEKIVVFAYHNEVIARLLSSLGSRAVAIYGKSSDREREEAKRRFNEDPDCQVMLGSIGAASMALNLSVSNHIVFVECDWSNGLMDQAKERCSNKEQRREVLIEYLVFDRSLDYYLLNKIEYKNAVVDRGIDLIYNH